MNQVLKKIFQEKQEGRKALAERSFSEKIAILEKLRERNRAIAASSLRREGNKEVKGIVR